MKAPKLDIQSILDDFQNLPKDIGAWPLAPRVAVLLGFFVLVLAAGWWVWWSEQLDTLAQSQQDELRLREDYVTKKTQAVNREQYIQQLNQIDRSFGVLLKQLPNKSEVESLLVEINQSGMGRGLQFDLFRPNPEVVKDFYAELPINVRLTGSYHDFGAFVGDVGKLSRIVTINNISIAPKPQTNDGTLVLEAVIKTFRYLDEEELAAKRKAEQAARGGRGGRR
ncbi:MAG: type 4a pilus biogenesis protein PilO [Candidatus Accumulibacter sp.]|jgi:type IV pilus assembly protein PilO|nr:type 4a pilus biogenesis protein PilO [Accumulibacter sp.]